MKSRWWNALEVATLAAIAIVLLGLLLPAISHPRVSRTGQCARNIRQLGLGVLAYSLRHHVFPPGTIPHPDLPPERRLSWMTTILDFMDHQELGRAIRAEEPWDSPANRALLETRVSQMSCPEWPEVERGLTSYVGIAGLGPDAPSLPAGHRRAGFFGDERQARPEDITDGAATTLMLAETSWNNGPWTAGGPATVRGVDPARRPYLGPGCPFGGRHRDGANVVFADGSVRFLSQTIDPRVFEALSTIAGGEALPRGWGEEP